MKAKNYRFRGRLHDQEPPPRTSRDIEVTARACRQRVVRRAWLSAAVSVVPLPGLDIAIDVGNVARMLQEINEAFGLTPEAIEALPTRQQFTVHKVVATLASSAVGRVVTHQVVQRIMRMAIKRLATRQIARSIPLAGQMIAATMAYTAVRLIGMRHIDDCVAVAQVIRTRGGSSAR